MKWSWNSLTHLHEFTFIKSLGLSMSVVTSMDINGGGEGGGVSALIFSKAVKANGEKHTQGSLPLIHSIQDPEECRKEQWFGHIQRHSSSFWHFFRWLRGAIQPECVNPVTRVQLCNSFGFDDDSQNLILNVKAPNIKKSEVLQHASLT